MIRFIGSILAVLALATLALGSNCHVQRVVVRGHYVAPIVAVQEHAYDYRLSYSPDLTDIVKELIADNRAMRADLIQALKVAPGGGPLLPLKAAHPGDLVMANKCAVCHDETTAKAKGGGKVYFKGGAFIDSPENVSAVIGAAIEDGSMPKGGKLSAEEKLDLMRRLVVQTGK